MLQRRAYCVNGRVLNIFIDGDDKVTKCDNYLLVRSVPLRLNDYNLLEYFSQYGAILNCYRSGQTDEYHLQYRDRLQLDQLLSNKRIHLIKSARVQIERETSEESHH